MLGPVPALHIQSTHAQALTKSHSLKHLLVQVKAQNPTQTNV